MASSNTFVPVIYTACPAPREWPARAWDWQRSSHPALSIKWLQLFRSSHHYGDCQDLERHGDEAAACQLMCSSMPAPDVQPSVLSRTMILASSCKGNIHAHCLRRRCAVCDIFQLLLPHQSVQLRADSQATSKALQDLSKLLPILDIVYSNNALSMFEHLIHFNGYLFKHGVGFGLD